MSNTLKPASVLAILAVAFAPAALAHVVVAPTMAAPGASETLTFIVGHGCNGQPTTALRVEVPKAVTQVEALPKTGWTSTIETLPGGARAVTWRGGEPLTKADGFPVRLRLPNQGGQVDFVAVQSCGETVVRWDEPIPASGPKPTRPAPRVALVAAGLTTAAPPASGERLPQGVKRLADGGLADVRGLPLYTFDYDTMAGMSHCEGDCARMWPPLPAPQGAQPFGPWSLVRRQDSAVQWALRDKPLYTYSADQVGRAPTGTEAPNWKRAK